MPLGTLQVDSKKLHTNYAGVIGKYYSVMTSILTHFKDKMEQTELQSAQLVNVKTSIYLFFLTGKHESICAFCEKETQRKRHTTRLSPLPFFPVSFKYNTMSGHKPMMLLTTSRRPGRERSPVSMASIASGLDVPPPSIE